MTYEVLDRQRVQYATYAEEITIAGDLTGRVTSLLVGDLATVTGSLTSATATSSVVSFAIPVAISDAAAAAYPFAIVLDVGSATLERTIVMGVWTIVARPDGTP
jgi:hypothetical protein